MMAEYLDPAEQNNGSTEQRQKIGPTTPSPRPTAAQPRTTANSAGWTKRAQQVDAATPTDEIRP